jgi:hypothetical protein
MRRRRALLTLQHHSLLLDHAAGAAPLVPSVAACRAVHNADIVGVPLDGVHGENAPTRAASTYADMVQKL